MYLHPFHFRVPLGPAAWSVSAPAAGCVRWRVDEATTDGHGGATGGTDRVWCDSRGVPFPSVTAVETERVPLGGTPVAMGRDLLATPAWCSPAPGAGWSVIVDPTACREHTVGWRLFRIDQQVLCGGGLFAPACSEAIEAELWVDVRFREGRGGGGPRDPLAWTIEPPTTVRSPGLTRRGSPCPSGRPRGWHGGAVGEGEGDDRVGFVATLRARLRDRADTAAAWLDDQRPRRPILDLVFRFFDRDGETAGAMLGSAVAFRFFLFVVPVSLLVVGLLGFLGGSVSADELSDAAGLGTTLRAQIRTALEQSQATRWVAVALGLAGSLWAGRALAKVLVAVSGFAWRQPVQRSTSLRVLASISGVLILTVVVLGAVSKLRAESGVAVATVASLGSALAYFSGWYVVSFMLPRPTRDPAAVLPGAALLALTTTGLQWLSQIWLPDRFARASQLYGAIGITAVTLAFFFLLGRVFVLAMVLNAVVWERFGTISTLVFSLPVLGRIPRRFPSVARFFGLDREAGRQRVGGPERVTASE